MDFKPGQQVWLSMKDLNMKRKTQKMQEKYISPYTILEVILTNAVKLKLPSSLKIHPVVNVCRLKKYIPPAFTGQVPDKPAPVEIDGEEEFEVEEILD